MAKATNNKSTGGLSTKNIGKLYSAYKVYQNWGRMNSAQRSRALASLGIQVGSIASGKDISKMMLIEPTSSNPGLSIGDAFSLYSSGVNVYGLTANWGQLNTIQRVLGGSRTALDVASMADKYGLIGNGMTGASTAVDGTKLAEAGWKAVPEAGVGAISAPPGTTLPAGYTTVYSRTTSQGAEMVAIPEANKSTAAVASSSNPSLYARGAQGALGAAQVYGGIQQWEDGNKVGGGLSVATGGANIASASSTAASQALGNVVPGLNIATGVYTIADNWGQGGAAGRVNGAMGGASIAAGLAGIYGMAALGGPLVLAGIVAAGLLAGSVKTGKHADQLGRDNILTGLHKAGYLKGEGYNFDLGDGTFVDLGIDGRGNRFSVKNKDMLVGRDRDERGGENSLNYYDIDYTNDMDYMSGMGGIALMRILNGGKNKFVDQTGGKLSNGILMNTVGQGAEWNEENFGIVRDKYRGVLASKGINSKEDAYALINKMYGDGRIDEADMIGAHQFFNGIYDDNGFQSISQIMQGRNNGIQVAVEDKDIDNPDTADQPFYTKPQNIKSEFIPPIDTANESLSKPPFEYSKPSAKDFENIGKAMPENIKNGGVSDAMLRFQPGTAEYDAAKAASDAIVAQGGGVNVKPAGPTSKQMNKGMSDAFDQFSFDPKSIRSMEAV